MVQGGGACKSLRTSDEAVHNYFLNKFDINPAVTSHTCRLLHLTHMSCSVTRDSILSLVLCDGRIRTSNDLILKYDMSLYRDDDLVSGNHVDIEWWNTFFKSVKQLKWYMRSPDIDIISQDVDMISKK